MKRDVRVYIEDILEAIAKIEEYMRGLNSEDDFYNNTQIQDAVTNPKGYQRRHG